MKYALIAAVFILASCASETEAPPRASIPPPPVSVAPTPDLPSVDQCGADKLQSLVGRSRLEIPVPVYPALQRVACTTCPVTMDYSPRRLNFFFDAETGIIKQVKCG